MGLVVIVKNVRGRTLAIYDRKAVAAATAGQIFPSLSFRASEVQGFHQVAYFISSQDVKAVETPERTGRRGFGDRPNFAFPFHSGNTSGTTLANRICLNIEWLQTGPES